MADTDETRDMPADQPLPESAPVVMRRGRIGATFGDYEIVGELGRGGMGVVYRARQIELNRMVALKMLTGHFGAHELQRFLAEAQTAASLHHTNIVHIYEVGEIDGSPFFSMEFVEGGTLSDKLRKGLPPPREVAELLTPVARALHFAHQHGVVHRDMKPQNILIDPDGVPKVADFGIAKRMNEDSGLTRSGAVIGTPIYMAPEQARGTSRDVGPAADVYALGAILYEMLTGRPPFLPEESETALTLRILSEETPSPAFYRPQTPRELEIICLKCLQKDPRDRYSSAAAFAEDLRRYLDDEGILARPPSRLVRAIKWTRRHPWKSTTSAALAVILAVSGHRLYQWDFYERPHTEYAAGIDYVWGGFEPVLRLAESDTAHRAVSLRLTRRGRRGPVTQVEVLNARGNPASLRRVLNDEVIPIYLESLTGSQPYSDKSPECTKVELVYEGNVVREVLGRDRGGSVNWRILYDRKIVSAGVANVDRARFVNLRGLDKNSSKGAALMEFERDASGHDLRITFFNTGGKPAQNGEGVYGYALERDARGRVVHLTNLGRDGQPAPNRIDLAACTFTWDAAGRVNRIDIDNAQGQPALLNGIAAVTSEYDSAGNILRIRRLGLGGQLAEPTNGDWAVQEIGRNEHGEVVSRKFFRAKDEGAPTPTFQQTYAYDDNGHPTEIGFFGPAKSRLALKHDRDGNLTEERFLDGDGHPVMGEKGYAMRRIAYHFGAQGFGTEDTYYDIQGAPICNAAGYRRLANEYDSTGVLRRMVMAEHDPARFGYSSYVTETEFDLQSHLQRSTSRYEDGEGHLVDAEKAGISYSNQEEEYDDNGREIITWQSGWSVKRVGAPVWRKDTTWYSSGVMQSRIWQAYDEHRQRLDTVANLDSARTEEYFDAVGKLERKLETEFDDKRLGFHSRELRFAASQLQGVLHRKADGTVLKDIRVLVVAIANDAQTATQQLHPGDQLLAANDTPVGSAYEWMLATDFPGGAIDILRDGQRMRLEGFQAGKLGVLLEDRGPVSP